MKEQKKSLGEKEIQINTLPDKEFTPLVIKMLIELWGKKKR